jgi:hypothetical protein
MNEIKTHWFEENSRRMQVIEKGGSFSSPLDASNIATGFGGNPTASVTTVTANDLVTATLSRFGTTDATTNRTSL